jgi:hypothetical protein
VSWLPLAAFLLLPPLAAGELIVPPEVREYAELEDAHELAARSYADEMGPWFAQGWRQTRRPYVVRETRRLEIEPIWEHYRELWAEDRRRAGFPEPPEAMTAERFLREDWLENYFREKP